MTNELSDAERRRLAMQAARDRGSVMGYEHHETLSLNQLAEALYEGTPHLSNLAEKLARQHGQGVGALSFFLLMGDDVQNFYRGIAKQLVDHAREWRPNQGSSCILSAEETARLKALPRVADAETQS